MAFPPAEKPARQRGNPRPIRAFRPLRDVEQYVNERTEKDAATGKPKVEFTALMNEVVRLFMDVERELGDEWWEIHRRAAVDKTTPGVVIAKIVKQSLKGSKR